MKRLLLITLLVVPLVGCERQARYQQEKREWIAKCIAARPADSEAVYNCRFLWENSQ